MLSSSTMSHARLMTCLLTLLGGLCLSTAVTAAPEWGPWTSKSTSLPESAYHRSERLVTESRNGSQPFQGLLRIYQLVLSNQDVADCPMYPSCSRYAMQAFATTDPLQAFFLSADRLVRDNPGAEGRYQKVTVGSRRLWQDFPEDHRLW